MSDQENSGSSSPYDSSQYDSTDQEEDSGSDSSLDPASKTALKLVVKSPVTKEIKETSTQVTLVSNSSYCFVTFPIFRRL